MAALLILMAIDHAAPCVGDIPRIYAATADKELANEDTMTLSRILHKHKITNPELQADLTKLLELEFQRGLDEGASCQAILETQGRERFLEHVRQQVAEGKRI
jgi:acyl-CoA reductase-like NAD-dependent aldehyde dehydrogenase